MTTKRKSAAPISTEILVVEDSITQAAQIRNLLESHHYKVTVAHNGREALNRLSKHKPALVISDIMMPEVNGYELCKKIKSNKNTENIPVILLTILADPEEIIEGLSCGADSFITKPYNENYLLSHVERILSRENVVYNEKVPFSAQILFKGKKRFIQAEQQNVIRLMLDIYESAINQNEKLLQTQEELRLLNERLESLVEDRTADLKEEIKLSNQIAGRLKKSEEKYRRLFENVHDLFYETSMDGTIIEISPSIKTLSKGQYSRDELIGKSMNDFYADPKQRIALLDILRVQGFVSDYEITLKNRDGKKIPCSISAKIIFDSADRPEKINGTMRNITDRKLVEENLKNSEERFKILFEYAPDAYYLNDLKGNLIDGNIAAEKLLGIERKELIGKSFLKLKLLTANQILKAAALLLKNALGQPTGPDEFELHRKDGSRVTVEIITHPVKIQGKTLVLGLARDITERKLAEEKLRFFALAVESSSDAIGMSTPDGRHIFQNKSFDDLFGIVAENQPTTVYVDEQVGREVFQSIMRGDTWTGEVKMRGKAGELLDVYLRAYAIKDDTGEIVGLVGVHNNITERKRAEGIISNERRLLRTLIDNLPDQIYVKDLDCRKIIANKSDVINIGFKEEAEVLGKTDIELFPGQTGERGYDDDKKVINSGKAILDREEDFIDKKGGRRWLLTSKIPLHDKDGKITGLVGIGRDITQRKEASEALRQSYTFIDSLLKTIPFGMHIVDQEGNVLFMSENFKEIFGDVINSKKCWELLKDDHMQCRNCPLTGEIAVGETNIYEADGVLGGKTFEITHTGMMYSGKKAMLEIFVDITERKEKEEELTRAKEKAEESDRLKTAFLNNISHEIRTPLNGILGFAEIMSQADFSEEEKQVSLSMLFESSNRLLDTITNYMDISLITSGNMSVKRKNFVPGQIIKQLLGKYKTICSGRKLELLLKLPEQSDQLSVNSDSEILNKIMSHLLSNAVKFTEKGSIQYGYTIHEKKLEFFVTDSGIGIGKESLENVFDHFIKEERGPLKITEGSGLGLSISKGLVELLGGKIRVESEKGKGSAFFFTIPKLQEYKSVFLDISKDSQNKKKALKTILVAEDDEINYFYLKALLRQITSAGIIHASNGREAVDKFKENPDIGLVLMDIKMPVMDGYTAIKLIRESKPDIPIVAQTAYTDDKTRILEEGCDGFLSKPFDKQKLLSVIKEFI